MAILLMEESSSGPSLHLQAMRPGIGAGISGVVPRGRGGRGNGRAE